MQYNTSFLSVTAILLIVLGSLISVAPSASRWRLGPILVASVLIALGVVFGIASLDIDIARKMP